MLLVHLNYDDDDDDILPEAVWYTVSIFSFQLFLLCVLCIVSKRQKEEISKHTLSKKTLIQALISAHQ